MIFLLIVILILGLIAAYHINLSKKITKLNNDLDKIKKYINFNKPTTINEDTQTAAVNSQEIAEHTINPVKTELKKDNAVNTEQIQKLTNEVCASNIKKNPSLLYLDKKIVKFFISGNVIVTVGIGVLFFGVVFLIKYAYEHSMLSTELRLFAITVSGVIMLIIGWRLRNNRRSYALILQGGALAVLYLTIFSALYFYNLIPPTLSFIILFIFASLSSALAVLQNSRSLAILGLIGGFLSPILVSSGDNNYIFLFNYYLVLNIGIFGISWFKSWRTLNVIGFLFTFTIATTWGYKHYSAEYFLNAEIFLIAFYLLYVAIAILFAFKQPIKLKGYVDSTLVFGAPLISFGLHAYMVKHIEFALSFSSVILAIFYISLATILWKRLSKYSKLLCETFIALGVIFITLSIPLAFNFGVTSNLWALEGAAAIWVGVRQKRLLPRLLGYTLLLLGGFALIVKALEYYNINNIIANVDYMGAIIVALSALFVAWILNKPITYKQKYLTGQFNINKQEKHLSKLFLTWGLLWWFIPSIVQINEKINADYQVSVLILFISLSIGTIQHIKTKTNWSQLLIPALSLLPALYIILSYILLKYARPFADWNIFSWIIAFTIYLWIIKQYSIKSTPSVKNLHILGFWLVVILFTIEAVWCVNSMAIDTYTWQLITIGTVPLIFMMSTYIFGHKISWTTTKHQELYQVNALLPIGVASWAWFLLLNLISNGDSHPLMYIPLLNPLDLFLIIQLVTLIYWQKFPLKIENWNKRVWRFEYSQLLIIISIFILLNTTWLRFTHHFIGIEFNFVHMLNSNIVQSGISILWSTLGLSSMIIGARKLSRIIWIAGASTMIAVVIKLFIFDLANTNSMERIISFISVGVILLIVGYFAPVPTTSKNNK